MYETLIMIKPGHAFSLEDMNGLLKRAVDGADCTVTQQGDSWLIEGGESRLEIGYHVAPHIVEESKEIAEEFGLDCAECVARYEMEGDDPDMLLFNDYLFINEELLAAGKFVLFDTAECKEIKE